MASPGQSITINGVKVQFPCKPYPSQLSMMDRILKGIDRRQNCLLESPTGSGKSLALLCSALAWQQAEWDKYHSQEEEESNKVCECQCQDQATDGATSYSVQPEQAPVPQPFIDITGDSADEDDDFRPDPRRSSLPKPGGRKRNHTEIGYNDGPLTSNTKPTSETPGGKECQCQCQSTVKKIKVPKIFFGTRTHKQIAQITKELGRTAYKNVRMCILASREHTCVDPEVSSMPHKNEECKAKLDGPGCRFQDRVRKISQRNIQNNGLQEAWDLEDFVDFCKKHKACAYFGARQLKDAADIVFSPYNYLVDPGIRESMEINLKNQIVILDEAHNIEDSAREAASYSLTLKQLEDAMQDLQSLIDERVKVKEHGALYGMCQGLHKMIEENQDKFNGADFDQASKVWNGIDMVAMLENIGIGPAKFPELRECLASVLDEDPEKKKKGDDLFHLQSQTTMMLKGLFMTLHFLFKDNLKFMEDFRVAIVRTMTHERASTDGRWLSKRKRGHSRMSWTYTMHFWCMNPGVAFSEVGDETRCIILTSGTLSPMNSFQSELGVPFPIQLEANHVISSSQVLVTTINKGPRGTPLLCNYQNTESFAFQDEIGNLVLDVCKTVPHGVLCFLPSYKLMDKLLDRWRMTGLYGQIDTIKEVMSEPRRSDKEDFDDLMKRFYDNIRKSEEQENIEDGNPGALFLAVCRGKVSEGLDFANNNARAVITIGIPFPNFKDTQVELKKQYNNMYSSKRGLLSGSEWYEIQAYRALNQALGRCIRHRFDWGALILVDERYTRNPNRYTKGLSKWVRQKVKHQPGYRQALSSLREFTEQMKRTPPGGDESFTASQLNATLASKSPGSAKDTPMGETSLLVAHLDTSASTVDQCGSPVLPNKNNQNNSTKYYSLFLPPAKPQQVVRTEQVSKHLSMSQAGGFLPGSQMSQGPAPTGSDTTNQAGGFLPTSQFPNTPVHAQMPNAHFIIQQPVASSGIAQGQPVNKQPGFSASGNIAQAVAVPAPVNSNQHFILIQPQVHGVVAPGQNHLQGQLRYLSKPVNCSTPLKSVAEIKPSGINVDVTPSPRSYHTVKTNTKPRDQTVTENVSTNPKRTQTGSDPNSTHVIPTPMQTESNISGKPVCNVPTKSQNKLFKFTKLSPQEHKSTYAHDKTSDVDRSGSPDLFDSEDQKFDSEPMDLNTDNIDALVSRIKGEPFPMQKSEETKQDKDLAPVTPNADSCHKNKKPLFKHIQKNKAIAEKDHAGSEKMTAPNKAENTTAKSSTVTDLTCEEKVKQIKNVESKASKKAQPQRKLNLRCLSKGAGIITDNTDKSANLDQTVASLSAGVKIETEDFKDETSADVGRKVLNKRRLSTRSNIQYNVGPDGCKTVKSELLNTTDRVSNRTSENIEDVSVGKVYGKICSASGEAEVEESTTRFDDGCLADAAEANHPKTKRSKRKRSSNTRMSSKRHMKGVVFDGDSDEEQKDKSHSGKCSSCGAKLNATLNTGKAIKVTELPQCLNAVLTSAANTKTGNKLTLVEKSMDLNLNTFKASAKGVTLNSVWLDECNTAVQFLCCPGCDTCLGFKVLATAEGKGSNLQSNQIWMFEDSIQVT